jgi:hypothetical protein
MSGTSVSAGHVAGAIAVVYEAFDLSDAWNVIDNVTNETTSSKPNLSTATVRQLLRNTGDNVSSDGFEYPRIDLEQAVKSVLNGTLELVAEAVVNESNVSVNETNFTVSNVSLESTTGIVTTSGRNFSRDNLTLNIVVNDTNEPVKNISVWYLDGESFPIFYAPFEANGNESAETFDYSNYAVKGRVNGSVNRTNIGVDNFSAYEFDGLNDFINFSAPDHLDSFWNGSSTISFWIMPRSDGEDNAGRIITKGTGLDTSISGWGIELNGDNGAATEIEFQHDFSTTEGNWRTTPNPIVKNQWNHVAITYDGTSTANNPVIYVGGASQSITEDKSPSGTLRELSGSNLLIGNDPTRVRSHDGYIDEIKFFNRTLSLAQIQALASNRTNLIVSDETAIGEVWSVNVTPNNGTEDGVPFVTESVTIREYSEPNVTGIVPTSGTTFNSTETIEVGATIVDETFVNLTLINITLPNTTVVEINLTSQASDFYNTSYFIPELEGTYNVLFFANDSDNIVNSTETTFFVSDNALPVIEYVNLTSTNGTNLSIENLTAIVFNATDQTIGEVVKNITNWVVNSSSIVKFNYCNCKRLLW